MERRYFFVCKTDFFPFQNNPENLDSSYETDLDLWDCYKIDQDFRDCFGRVKLVP